MKKMKLLTSLILTGVMASTAFSSEPVAQVEFARPLGMGGAFTAVADDNNIFNYNPAGLVQRTGGELTILELGAGGNLSDLNEYKDFIDENEDDLKNWETLSGARVAELTNEINTNISKLNPRVYVAGSVASYVSGPTFLRMPIHVGFGAIGAADVRFKLERGPTTPSLTIEGNTDAVIPVSIAKRFDAPLLPGKIGIGFTGKFIQRNQVKEEQISVTQLDDLEAPPVSKGSGIGSDLGLLYQPTERVNVGVMVKDFLGTKISFDAADAEKGYQAKPAHDSVIKPVTNVGVALTPSNLLWLLPTGDRLMLAADVRDILADDEHIFFENGFKKPFGEDIYKHVHLGAEYRYWFFRFRGGAYQGYPSFGLGIDIPFFKLDYAFYSREIGPRAGDLKEENHIFSLAIKFGTGNTEARERIGNSGENKKNMKMSTPEVEPTNANEPVETPPASEQKDSTAPGGSSDSIPQ